MNRLKVEISVVLKEGLMGYGCGILCGVMRGLCGYLEGANGRTIEAIPRFLKRILRESEWMGKKRPVNRG
jgi:hypothetical protein